MIHCSKKTIDEGKEIINKYKEVSISKECNETNKTERSIDVYKFTQGKNREGPYFQGLDFCGVDRSF